jgi:hypothetical protein
MSLHPDDDSLTAADSWDGKQERRKYPNPLYTNCREHENNQKLLNTIGPQMEELAGQYAKIASDIGWYIKIGYGCWGALGLLMYFVVWPAVTTLHTNVDTNNATIQAHERQINDLMQSRQRRVDRSRDDHRNCHDASILNKLGIEGTKK